MDFVCIFVSCLVIRYGFYCCSVLECLIDVLVLLSFCSVLLLGFYRFVVVISLRFVLVI